MNETFIRPTLRFLQENGWIKNRLNNSEGAHCLMGAVLDCSRFGLYDLAHYSYSTTQAHYSTAIALADVIESAFPDRLRPIISHPMTEADQAWIKCVQFNNHPDTTFADIELVCEKAAAEVGEL